MLLALAAAVTVSSAPVAALDRLIERSFARERWSWVPVYGLVVVLRGERERDRLLAQRVEAQTRRIQALERP